MQSGTERVGIDEDLTDARYELEAAQRVNISANKTAAITQLEQSIKRTNEYQQALDRVRRQDEEAEQIENKRKMNRSVGLYDFRAGRGSTQYAFMTDDEKAIYDILRTSDPKGAQEYAEYLQYTLNTRVAQNEAETLNNMGTVGNILGYVGAGLTAPKTLITQGYNAIRGALNDEYKPVDYNAARLPQRQNTDRG